LVAGLRDRSWMRLRDLERERKMSGARLRSSKDVAEELGIGRLSERLPERPLLPGWGPMVDRMVVGARRVGGTRGPGRERRGMDGQLGCGAAHSCGSLGCSPLRVASTAYRKYAAGSPPQILALSNRV